MDAFFHFVYMLGGAPSAEYPRWLRRAYIALWPIAAPVRYMLLMTFVLLVVTVCGIGWPLDWIAEKISDVLWEIKHQWNHP